MKRPVRKGGKLIVRFGVARFVQNDVETSDKSLCVVHGRPSRARIRTSNCPNLLQKPSFLPSGIVLKFAWIGKIYGFL